MYYTRHQSGTTIVEVLVYLLLFTLLSGGALTMLFSLQSLFTQYRVKQILFSSGTTFMERTLTEIREADSVVLSESVIASSTAGALALNYGVNTTKIVWGGSQAKILHNNSDGGILHGESVTIDGLTFYYYEQNGKELVRVVATFSTTVGEHSESLTLRGGAIVRGTYESP